jgi:hypothetical protein
VAGLCGAAALPQRWRPRVAVPLPRLCLVNLWPVYRAETKPRWDRAAAVLAAAVRPGDTVYAVDPNGPAMLETLRPAGPGAHRRQGAVDRPVGACRRALGGRQSRLGRPRRSMSLDREITGRLNRAMVRQQRGSRA